MKVHVNMYRCDNHSFTLIARYWYHVVHSETCPNVADEEKGISAIVITTMMFAKPLLKKHDEICNITGFCGN